MTPPGIPTPPQLMERLLRACLPSGTVGDSMVGDAREEFFEYARDGRPLPAVWYFFHALSMAGPYVREAVMDTILKDIRYGARSLMRQPGSAVISVLIMALGIGLSTFMFSIVYGVFARGLDVPEADRLAVLQMIDTRQTGNNNGAGVGSQDFMDFRERARSFSGLAGYWGGTVNISDDDGPERFQGMFVSANAFDVLRAQPVLGRTFREGEDAPGMPPTVVLGYHVWRDRYNSDPGVVGKSIRVNGRQGTIVGVMPEGFRWPTNSDVWVTMDDDPSASARRAGRFYSVLGRLADGVSWDQANLDVARVAGLLEQEHPEENEALTAQIVTVSQAENGDELVTIFTAMMVAVLCVLLVACANVANLLLGRAAMRTREAGVRVAMGAGRRRVMVPFMAEAFVLAGLGAILGTGLAYWGVGLFDAATDTSLTGRPYFMVFTVDLPVLLYVVGVTGLAALIAGIFPALQISKTDVNSVLKDESRGSSSLHMGRLSKILVMVEVALSVALLVGAGLMTKSMVTLNNHELPFVAEEYVTARAGLFESDYPESQDRLTFWEEAERRIAALPGVRAAALAGSVPGVGGGFRSIRLEGQVYPEPADRPMVHHDVVSAAYFETMDAPFLEGQGFADHHTAGVAPVAVVNQSFARRFWPGESALGRTFRTGLADTIPYMTVIGVVPDLQMQGFQPRGNPRAGPEGFYTPVTQSDERFLTIIARAASGPAVGLAPALREAIRGIDSELPLYNVRDVPEALWRTSWFYSVFGTIFIIFGGAALFMASAGLYGVLSFSVSQRTREMGLRMALGAGGRDVIRMVLRQGSVQVGAGLVIGLVMAAGVSNVVALLVFEVNPRDPTVFGGVVGLIVAVGVLASFIPARRATQVDPMVALRME